MVKTLVQKIADRFSLPVKEYMTEVFYNALTAHYGTTL
jgi:hypothetical protein